MAQIGDKQKKLYEEVLNSTKAEIKEYDSAIEEELAKVKERLASLQEQKKQAIEMYGAACRRLGVANEFEEEGE